MDGDVVPGSGGVVVVLGIVVLDDSEEAEQGQDRTLSRQGKKGRK